MDLLTRRALLVLGAAAATGCARRSPAAPTVAAPRQPLYVAAQMQIPVGGPNSQQAIYQRAEAYAHWFEPVASAFTAVHPSITAVSVPEVLPPVGQMLRVDPRVSVSVGGDPVGVDLAPYLHGTNFDPTILLPGLLAAATQADGQVQGVPVDFGMEVMTYDSVQLHAANIKNPPATGWTVPQLVDVASSLAAHGGLFGPQLGLASYGQQGGPAWLGFALGYGGEVFVDGRLRLTDPNALAGLNAYADLLHVTWSKTLPRVNPSLAFQLFSGVDQRLAGKDNGPLARFPQMPVKPVVPARVRCARVYPLAPQIAAGAEFATWLLSEEGQRSLTAIGFPTIRVGMSSGRSWLSAEKFNVRLEDLRFLPGTWTSLDQYQFALDPRITSALAQPAAARLPLLRNIETTVNAYLAGDVTASQAVKQLGPIAGPCDATSMDGQCAV